MASFGSDRELPLKATEAIGEAQLSEACSVSVAEFAQEFDSSLGWRRLVRA